jgi:hypothetical protein
MSRFVCTTCNREFTTKYGLKKHSEKKIPCKAEKITKYHCNKCNLYLSSKRNLSEHIFNHRLDYLKNPKNIIENTNIIKESIKDILSTSFYDPVFIYHLPETKLKYRKPTGNFTHKFIHFHS